MCLSENCCSILEKTTEIVRERICSGEKCVMGDRAVESWEMKELWGSALLAHEPDYLS